MQETLHALSASPNVLAAMFDIARESEIAVYLDDAWKFPTRPAVRDLKAGGRVALALWYQYYKQLDDAYDWCLHAYWTVAPEIQTAGCFGEDRMLDTTEVSRLQHQQLPG